MLDKLNPKNLSVIRNYLPEIVMTLLTVAVVRQHIDQRAQQKETDRYRTEQIQFERDINTKVIMQLSQNTEAMNQMKDAFESFLGRQRK
jgi:sensor domain CHASE-containing protein